MRRTALQSRLQQAHASLASIAASRVSGRVTAVSGMAVDVAGGASLFGVGDRLCLVARDQRTVAGEVIGFREHAARVMTFAALNGVGPGSIAHAPLLACSGQASVCPSDGWLGRVINPLGEPLDASGALPRGPQSSPAAGQPAGCRARGPASARGSILA